MKRVAILLVILLLLGVTLQVRAPMLAQTGALGPARYGVEAGTVAGGGYQLSSLAWQISGTTSAGAYRLSTAVEHSLRGSGCCCTYLPCVLRNK